MPFDISIPTAEGPMEITVGVGSSVVFVGANGAGKTRLATYIEDTLALNAHRISAHRSLVLNPAVAKIAEQDALLGLRTGYANSEANINYRIGHRWKSKAAVMLLNDFDYLVQALFADQSNISLKTHQRVRAGDRGPAEPTKLEHLVDICARLLPHRKLHVTGDNIEVSIQGSNSTYNASEMSDGERALFYMIGQTLVAADNSLLIFDEPEIHVHRSIMAKLWDELEAARQDCAFVFITHDLEFAASRVAQKFVIRDYDPSPRWTIDPVPEDSGFDEEITTLILGSRKPVLFVEGTDSSLDLTIYRCCYPEWTVIPRNSCQEVIHSVVTMRRNKDLTRVTCSGIVDADDYQPDDIAYLEKLGIAVLPVSEIENIILMPSVSRAIAESEGYESTELESRLDALKAVIFNGLNSDAAINDVVTRYCRRRIDRFLKKIDLSASKDVATITTEYTQQTTAINIDKIAQEATDRITSSIRDNDLQMLLKSYDCKGKLVALAAEHLKRCKKLDFENWLVRVLRNGKAPAVASAIESILPKIQPQ